MATRTPHGKRRRSSSRPAPDTAMAGRRRLDVMRAALIAAVVVAAGLAAQAAPATSLNCGSRTLGPGALVQGRGPGPACLLRAFQQRCRPATYTLLSFGVDTGSTTTFRTVRRATGCQVAVTISFRVIPHPPKQTGTGYCRTLRRVGENVIAGRCTGTGLPATVSLTQAR
jgi:hypothetical protein